MLKRTLATIGLLTMLSGLPGSALAGGSARHLSQAVNHSVQGLAHASAAGATLVSGVAAVPLTLSGAAGRVSAAAGEQLWRAATTSYGEPLPLAEEAVSAGPAPNHLVGKGGE